LHCHNQNEKDDERTMNATLGRKYKKLETPEENTNANTNLTLSKLKDVSKVRSLLQVQHTYTTATMADNLVECSKNHSLVLHISICIYISIYILIYCSLSLIHSSWLERQPRTS
jgi:hypothetical protein